MIFSRSVRPMRAAINCLGKAINRLGISNPRVVIVSDTPSVVKIIKTNISTIAEVSMIYNLALGVIFPTNSLISLAANWISFNGLQVLHFDYKRFRGDISQRGRGLPMLDFRIKDWGPAPRWVAFVDFFLACRAKQAVISGANRRVGTTYAQLVAALAAANSIS